VQNIRHKGPVLRPRCIWPRRAKTLILFIHFTMYALMNYFVTLLNECLITYITAIWTLTTMYALMIFHVTLLNECLVAHITAIWTLTTVYTLMI